MINGPLGPQHQDLASARLALLALRLQAVSDPTDPTSYVIAPDESPIPFDAAVLRLAHLTKPLACEARVVNSATVQVSCAPVTDRRRRSLDAHAERVSLKLRQQAGEDCAELPDDPLVLVIVGPERLIARMSVLESWVHDYAMHYSMSSRPEDCKASGEGVALRVTLGPPGRFLIFPDTGDPHEQ